MIAEMTDIYPIFAYRTKYKSYMKKAIFLLVMMLQTLALDAQITLEECQQLARENYPAIRQYELVEQSRDFTLANAATGYLPQISISGYGIWHSDIIKSQNLPLDMKNTLGVASVMVNQSIYDGGTIAANRQMARAQADVEQRQTDITLYDIRDRIQQLYFGILLIDERVKQNHLLQDDLNISKSSVESLMKAGMANQSDIDAIQVQLIKAKQQESSLQTQRRTYLSMLGIFISKELDENTSLTVPVEDSVLNRENNRPELRLFEAQSLLADAQRKQIDSRLMPKVGAFGLGMLNTGIGDLMKKEVFAAGLSLSWNIGALYTRKNDLRQINIRKQQIDANRETFLLNTRLQTVNEEGNLKDLRNQVSQDEEIIRLSEQIRLATQKKVEGGTETVNELLRTINAVSEARQQQALHRIQLLQESYKLKHTLGN